MAHDVDSLFWEPDLSLPPPPSPYQSISDFDVDLSRQDASPVTIADSPRENHESMGKCLIRNKQLACSDLLSAPPLPPRHSLSEPPSVLPQTFSSERNGVGSVDWPPAGSTLFPEGEKVGQDDGAGVQVSNITLPYI